MAEPLVALQATLPQFADPVDLYSKAYTLRDLAAKAQAADQLRADDQAARSAFAANPTDGAARLSALANVSPAAYSAEAKRQADLGKTDAETRAKQLETAHKQLDLAGQAFGYVRKNPTLENATSAIKWLSDNGVYTPEQAAQYTKQVQDNPAGIQALADQAFTATLATKDQLPKIETKDNGGQLITQAIDPISNKVSTLSTMAKVQNPDSIASNARIAAEGAANRAQQASEGRANRAQQLQLARERKDAGDTEASLDSDTLGMMAKQYLRGDKSVLQNLGRGAQGSANLVALRKAITNEAKSQGIGGEEIAARMADFQGQTAGLRTAATISARVENAAAEVDQLMPLAIESGRKVARSGILAFGKGQNIFDNQTNDPDFNRFAAGNIALATAYAGVMARGGKATVNDIEHARQILSTQKSQPAYEATAGMMLREVQAAKAAPNTVRAALRGQISGNGGHGEPAAGSNKVVDFGSLK